MTNHSDAQAATPQAAPPRTAELVGEVVRVFTDHGMRLEKDLAEARQGAQNLGAQLSMAHRAMEEGEHQIGQHMERIDQLEGLLEEAFSLVGKAFCRAERGVTIEWMEAASGWSDRVNAGRTARLNLTDEMPMPAPRKDDRGLHAHDCVERDCTGCFDVGA